MDIQERIMELEIQLTHQESTISDLNDVVISQQKSIDQLESRLNKLENMIKLSSTTAVKDLSDETPPPHY